MPTVQGSLFFLLIQHMGNHMVLFLLVNLSILVTTIIIKINSHSHQHLSCPPPGPHFRSLMEKVCPLGKLNNQKNWQIQGKITKVKDSHSGLDPLPMLLMNKMS